jgi:hypothetical protein
MLYGRNLTNITVDGGGTIDGGVYDGVAGLASSASGGFRAGDADKVRTTPSWLRSRANFGLF